MSEQEGTTAEEVLLYLIAQLVEHPDQVELEIEESDTKINVKINDKVKAKITKLGELV